MGDSRLLPAHLPPSRGGETADSRKEGTGGSAGFGRFRLVSRAGGGSSGGGGGRGSRLYWIPARLAQGRVFGGSATGIIRSLFLLLRPTYSHFPVTLP